jgi:branched-chain amino acid transport system permease protein
VGIRSSRVTATAGDRGRARRGRGALHGDAGLLRGRAGRGTHAIALIAFPAAIIGGLDSMAGAVVGGIIVGLTEALSAQYISFDFSKSAVFLVMLVVLVIRPSGLFGTKELTRV